MRSPAAERALRRMVAKLAAAAPEDADLVLDALEPAQADEVRRLLEAYGTPAAPVVFEAAASARPADPPRAAPVVETGPEPSRLAGVSPWLAERLSATGAAQQARLRMTPTTAAALAQLAATLPAADAGPEIEIPDLQRPRRVFRWPRRAR